MTLKGLDHPKFDGNTPKHYLNFESVLGEDGAQKVTFVPITK
jgi:hypothetical protein